MVSFWDWSARYCTYRREWPSLLDLRAVRFRINFWRYGWGSINLLWRLGQCTWVLKVSVLETSHTRYCSVIIFFTLSTWFLKVLQIIIEGKILDSTTSVVSHMMHQQSCHETKWNWTVGWSPKYADVDVQPSQKLFDKSKMYSRAPHTSQSCALTRSPWHRPQSQTWFECTMLQRCSQSTSHVRFLPVCHGMLRFDAPSEECYDWERHLANATNENAI